MIRKVSALLVLVTLAIFAMIASGPYVAHGQGGQIGAAQVPGYFAAASNATVNAAIGNALNVTNPAANFLMLVQGGPVYCSGAEVLIGQSTIQLVANNTYLIVANCAQQNVYAKVAVTGPGSQGTSAINGPGTPAQILAPIFGLEIPIATVVCNATACGNGGQGSITDNRPVANFPGAGTPLNTTTFANLPTSNVTDGTMIICTNCAVAVGGVSATCTSGAVVNLAIREGGAWVCR